MKNKYTSLKDLAKELNVSISTVSRALKDHPDISEKVKKKIKALALKHGYTPNPLAMALLKQETRMIGVIVPDLVTHFYSSIIAGIESYAKEQGYFIILASSYESYNREMEAIENLLKVRVEGLLICLSKATKITRHFKTLLDMGVPFVFFDRIALLDAVSSVTVDNHFAAKNITNHLYEQGYRRIALITGPAHLNICKERLTGYHDGLKASDLALDPNLVVESDLTFDSATLATKKLLSLAKPPDAILAINDTVAFAVMQEVKKQHLKIPSDIGLVGFSDEFHATLVDPPLTSVSHPTYEMGREAARLLFDSLTRSQPVKRIILNTRLEVRASSEKVKLH